MALRQEHYNQLKKRWKTLWCASPHFPRLWAYGTLPSPAFLALTQKIQTTQAQASLLFQLRTSHIALRGHLYRIKKATSPQCPSCGAPRETVVHFLFECPAHLHEHICYLRPWRQKERDLSFLLSEPKATLSLIGYIRDTAQLKQTLGKLRDRP